MLQYNTDMYIIILSNFFQLPKQCTWDGTILWCISVSQFLVFQYMCRYSKMSTVYVEIFEACKISRISQIQHFHDLIFEDHQVSCSPIWCKSKFANEISRMKISRKASQPKNLVYSIDVQYINVLPVYWSMNCFLQWIKLWNWYFTENRCENKPCTLWSWLSYCFQLTRNHILYTRTANTFKDWCIAISWYVWHDASILLESILFHLYNIMYPG